MKLRDKLIQMFNLPKYIKDGIVYRLSGFLFTPRPKFICFPITFRCNSRCQMCNVWQNPSSGDEIDLKTIEEIFSNQLFRKVEEVVLHGGEPTLRKDISDIYEIVVNSCPKLKKIISSTNGLNPAFVAKRLDEILTKIDPETVCLTFTVSIDGLKEAHEKIRGIPGGFDRALETIEVLKEYRERFPLEVQIITVIQPQNLHELNSLESLGKSNGVEVVFQPMMIDSFYGNSPDDPRLQFSELQFREYREFIEKRFMQGKTPKSLYWKNYRDMLNGKKRAIPCAYDRYVLSLYPTGDILPCARENWILFGNIHENPADEIWYGQEAKKIRKRMRSEVCPKCDFYCGAEYSLKKEFFTYFGYYLKTSLASLFRISKS